MLTLDIGSRTDILDTARESVRIDLGKRQANKPSNFICTDAHCPPFRTSVLAEVNIYEVIEHVEDPIRYLRDI